MSLAAIIARAAPPPERAGDGPFEPVVTGAAALARRRARVVAAFGSPARLAAHADALGLAPDAWLDQFRDVRLAGPPPDWARAFGAVFARLSDGTAPFAEVRRWAGAEAAARWPADLARGPDALEGPLDYLAGRLGMVLQPAMYVEAQLGARHGWATRFRRSPALAHAVGRIVADWLSDLATIVARAAADRPVLARAMFDRVDPGALVGIECGLGDPHAGGRSVAVLHFESGPVVYKPKDLRVADTVGDIVGLVGEAGLAPPWRVMRNGYAWERLYEARRLVDRSEADAFYRALGSWLALLQPLGATDFWFDNLIAEGATPRFVDFETAVQPSLRPPAGRPAVAGAARAALAASPLGVGILPTPFPLRDGEDPTDIGCMARPGKHRMPLSAPGHGEAMSWHEDRFAPRLADGPPADAADHFEAFEDGYFRMAEALASPVLGRRAVELLQAAGDAPVRIICIDTWTCYRAINASLAPRHLADGVWREIALHAALAGHPEMIGAIREAAVRDLRRLDVPLFQARLSSRDLSGCEGECRPEFFEQDAVAATQKRLRTLAALSRDERAAWLRSGFGLRAGNPPWRAPGRAVPAPADGGDLLAWADEIATGIVRLSVGDDGGRPTWIGRYHDVFTGVQGLGPLGFDILSGRAGLALALRELGQRLNRRDLSGLASESLAGAAQDYLDRIEFNLAFGAGYVVGAGGLVAALAQVRDLSGLAADVFRRASQNEIWLRSGDDYVSGLAGWREAVRALGGPAPTAHGAARSYAPAARPRLARWLTAERMPPLCPDRRTAARLRRDRDRHGSWFATLWLDDRYNLSGIDGVPALALAFARLAGNEQEPEFSASGPRCRPDDRQSLDNGAVPAVIEGAGASGTILRAGCAA